MQTRARQHPRLRFIWNSEVVKILGDDKVTGLRLRHTGSGELTDHPTDGVFIAIGHKPSSDLFRGRLDRDRNGYLVVDERKMSSIEGVFVAGDVHDHEYRQAVTAAGFGAMAAINAERWLQRARCESLDAHDTKGARVAAGA